MVEWCRGTDMKNIVIALRKNDEFPELIKNNLGEIELDLDLGHVTTIYTFNKLPMEKVYILGLGDGSNIKKAFIQFAQTIKENVFVYVDEEMAYQASLGLYYGAYSYLDNNREYEFSSCSELVQQGKEMAECINYARYLSDMPRNILTPIRFKEEAEKVANEYGLEIEVLSNEELEQMGANSILAVNSGSKYPCFIIKLKYNGNGDAPYTAIVGKGLTYDSGGYSLKKTMAGMKYDMCGAANVLATIKICAQMKYKVNCMAVLCITENMIGPDAYAVDDVITSLNGKTIEVTNTDAEGRMALIDGITYCQKDNVNRLIDMATLTGACANALGENYTGAFTNNEAFLNELKAVCLNTKEKIWQMPLDEDFHKQIHNSNVADLTNAQVGKKAGASLAAAFIEEFIEEHVAWIHLDIAATSKKDNQATGVLIESLSQLLK